MTKKQRQTQSEQELQALINDLLLAATDTF
jgi:hypothetical protein